MGVLAWFKHNMKEYAKLREIEVKHIIHGQITI